MARARSADDRKVMVSIAGMMSSFYGEFDENFRAGGGNHDHLYCLAAGDKKHHLARWFAQEMGRKFAALTLNPYVWGVEVWQWDQSRAFTLPIGGGKQASLTNVGTLSPQGYVALTRVEIPGCGTKDLRVRDVISLVPAELQIGANLCDAIGGNRHRVPGTWAKYLLPGTEWASEDGKRFMAALTNDGLAWWLSMAPMDHPLAKDWHILQQYKL
jgi:hypothetical protein